MTHDTQEKPLYYAKDGMVWKRPTKTNFDGETILAIGFPVCEMHEAAGADCAPIVAHLMNLGEAAQSGTGADLRKQIADLGAEVARLSSRLNARVAASEIARLRELLAKATGQPWYVVHHSDGWTIQNRLHGGGMPIARRYGANPDDPEAIVEAVNALPSLLDNVERVEAENAELHRLLEETREENGQLSDENSELRNAPWPEWAEACLRIVREHTGSNDDEVDLREELQEVLGVYAHENEKLRAEVAAVRARIAELEARAPVVTEAQADALLQKVCGCYRCGRGAVGNEERCDQMLKLAHAEFAALAVTGTGDGSPQNWLAARAAFLLWANRYRGARTYEAASVILDIAPAEIVKAWKKEGNYEAPPGIRDEKCESQAHGAAPDASVSKSVFSPDEVVALAANQTGGQIHPFTCPNRGDGIHRTMLGDLGALVPTTRGWICPFCDYTQGWAHDFMKRGLSPNRFLKCLPNEKENTFSGAEQEARDG